MLIFLHWLHFLNKCVRMEDVNVLNGPHMQTISDEFLWCHIIHVAIIVTLYTHTHKCILNYNSQNFLTFKSSSMAVAAAATMEIRLKTQHEPSHSKITLHAERWPGHIGELRGRRYKYASSYFNLSTLRFLFLYENMDKSWLGVILRRQPVTFMPRTPRRTLGWMIIIRGCCIEWISGWGRNLILLVTLIALTRLAVELVVHNITSFV